MSVPFSHFRAFFGFREPKSSFKRYNNNICLFLEYGLDFRTIRNLPKEVSVLKQQRLPKCHMSIKIFNSRESGYFPTSEDYSVKALFA